MKQTILVTVLLTVLVLSWGSVQGGDYGPVRGKQILCQEGCGNEQITIKDGLFDRIVEMAEGADNEEELRDGLENDPLVQKLVSSLGGDITVRILQTGYCYLTPLICLWRSHAPDLNCTYNCIGLYGLGELSTDETADCDRVIGCILFQNCLAICITIIPHEPPPVIR